MLSETAGPTLRTQRLLLRQWRDADLAPFAAMNADPRVMEHFPNRLSRDDSDAWVGRIQAALREHGFGLWAVEVTDSAPFIGYVGLSVPRFAAPFMPAVEIGWRLGASYWGNGYAREAAHAVLAYGFTTIGLAEIISFTVPANRRSRAVMAAIGMTHDPADDFDHPKLAVGSPMRRHVLYRIANPTAK